MARTDFEIPEDFFGFDGERGEDWPDHPEVRRAVEWLRGAMPPDEWVERRLKAARTMYEPVVNGVEPGKTGRFFEPRDTFAWYLFQAEAFIDHVWNYDPVFGARVVPVFASLGRNLDLLKDVGGLDVRVARMVGEERAQPNGPLFELLVAAAYRRAGAGVEFVPEERGGERRHDLDATFPGRTYAVEAKRMEVSAFGDSERVRMRELWGPSAKRLAGELRSTFAQFWFHVPVADLPDDYVTKWIARWLGDPGRPLEWDDAFGNGRIVALDLAPIRSVLAENEVLTHSMRILELLTGRYRRHQSVLSSIRMKRGTNPRYAKDCDYASILEWTPLAEKSISGRARDVLRKVADANDQLPRNRPGTVHVGFEAVEGDGVEEVRHARIVASLDRFDPGDTPLQYVYTHFLAPESPPDESWTYDETVDVRAIRPTGPSPVGRPFLVVPESEHRRTGAHWD